MDLHAQDAVTAAHTSDSVIRNELGELGSCRGDGQHSRAGSTTVRLYGIVFQPETFTVT
jgi:hypothetical protein